MKPSTKLPLANDSLVADLLTAALVAIERGDPEARMHVLKARSLVLDAERAPEACCGGLAAWQMRRIEEFVRRNLAAGPRLNIVGRALRLTPCHLSRAFKATAGTTFSAFVQEVRVELAKRLLLETDQPISEIALSCGLTDQSHLTRIFKRETKMPPAAWRRRMAATELGWRLDVSERGRFATGGLAAG